MQHDEDEEDDEDDDEDDHDDDSSCVSMTVSKTVCMLEQNLTFTNRSCCGEWLLQFSL